MDLVIEYAAGFEWADVCLSCIQSTLAPSQVNRSVLVQGHGIDSDCTRGAMAFETAMSCLQAAGGRRGLQLDFTPKAVCEKDQVMLEMASDRLPATTCRFVDATDIFAVPDPYSLINSVSTYEDKFALAWSLPRSAVARCVRHMSWCPILSDASCKMTGIPCQDFSAIGNRSGLLGKNMAVAFAAGFSLSLSTH